jgi:hypothetical protein
MFNACVVNAGNTGGFCNSQGVGVLYAIEYVFSYYPPLFLLMLLGLLGLGIPNGARVSKYGCDPRSLSLNRHLSTF